jgi:hypothetical protein
MQIREGFLVEPPISSIRTNVVMWIATAMRRKPGMTPKK